ncbi:hypothetical protein BGY98DRAFT_938336 [Russula aff. rugulosa BPL654]|nr:hypothetical protein BGY98DRAFT_938336 [Russula aff. rugulosa BPL654]
MSMVQAHNNGTPRRGLRQRCNQNSMEKEYRIYDVKAILDMIRCAESNDSIQNAQNWAVRYVQERAIQLGKNGWLEDPWGRSEQRQRRDRLFLVIDPKVSFASEASVV